MKALIDTEPHLEVIGEAADGREAVTKVKSQDSDVVLMDLVMPEMDGVEAICEITKVDPAPKILILISFSEEEKIIQAIKAGATGYLIKDASPDELVNEKLIDIRGDRILLTAKGKRLSNRRAKRAGFGIPF